MIDAFLKVSSVPGESKRAGYEDQIEVISYQHAVMQPRSRSESSSGGATVGRSEHGDFSITKEIDAASPLLVKVCDQGEHLDSVLLTLCRAGGASTVPFMTYEMRNAIITKVEVIGTKDGLPHEVVSFNYGVMEWTYTAQKRKTGGGGGKIHYEADLMTARKV